MYRRWSDDISAFASDIYTFDNSRTISDICAGIMEIQMSSASTCDSSDRFWKFAVVFFPCRHCLNAIYPLVFVKILVDNDKIRDGSSSNSHRCVRPFLPPCSYRTRFLFGILASVRCERLFCFWTDRENRPAIFRSIKERCFLINVFLTHTAPISP